MSERPRQVLPRLIASAEAGNAATLIRLLAQIAARQASTVPAKRVA